MKRRQLLMLVGGAATTTVVMGSTAKIRCPNPSVEDIKCSNNNSSDGIDSPTRRCFSPTANQIRDRPRCAKSTAKASSQVKEQERETHQTPAQISPHQQGYCP
jgi:hypothetical protein